MFHSNQFGRHFSYTSWGESHGKGIGCLIQGCPSGIQLNASMIQEELQKRRPGNNPFTSPRQEKDLPEILSGVFEGKTTGAPLHIWIPNKDCNSQDYKKLASVYRPGHANYTYLHKYGLFDYRGGGRSSARETACRVAAGAVAKQLLANCSLQFATYLKQVGPCISPSLNQPEEGHYLEKSPLFCWHPPTEKKIKNFLNALIQEGDSVGALVECVIFNTPVGLGEPVIDKLEARLALGMMSLPASKGFAIGKGFEVANLKGSEHNDTYQLKNGKTSLQSNHAGGTLGGLSTGEPLSFKVAFKPTSSIQKTMETVDFQKKQSTSISPANQGRHDPCLGIRAVPCVEAMAAITLADFYLLNQLSSNKAFSMPLSTSSCG